MPERHLRMWHLSRRKDRHEVYSNIQRFLKESNSFAFCAVGNHIVDNSIVQRQYSNSQELHYSYLIAIIIPSCLSTVMSIPKEGIMRLFPLVLAGVVAILFVSCSTLNIQNVDFSWPVEVVATVSNTNIVSSDRYGLAFSVAAIAQEELQDSSALRNVQVHVLRNGEGFYFVTAAKFKHVYVFRSNAGELSLENAIEIGASPLQSPALNLRTPYVELLDASSPRGMLTHSEIVQGEKK